MILDEQRKYVSSLTEEISKRGAGIPGHPGQVSFEIPRYALVSCPDGEEVEKKGYCALCSYRMWIIELAAHILFFLQISQQELDTIVNTQHEILRHVNEMK